MHLIIMDAGRAQEREHRLKKMRCKTDVKEKKKSNRNVKAWNSVDERIGRAGNIHKFRTRLKRDSYGSRTTQDDRKAGQDKVQQVPSNTSAHVSFLSSLSDWFRFPSFCVCKCYDIPLHAFHQRTGRLNQVGGCYTVF